MVKNMFDYTSRPVRYVKYVVNKLSKNKIRRQDNLLIAKSKTKLQLVKKIIQLNILSYEFAINFKL
jgi:hypothetical protein